MLITFSTKASADITMFGDVATRLLKLMGQSGVTPGALLIPMVGYDAAGNRLGYGGGFYDRTLATFTPRPFCIGIAYDDSQLETIYPQPHDIPMNVIVTERRVLYPDT